MPCGPGQPRGQCPCSLTCEQAATWGSGRAGQLQAPEVLQNRFPKTAVAALACELF